MPRHADGSRFIDAATGKIATNMTVIEFEETP